jgi:hypothetical protein
MTDRSRTPSERGRPISVELQSALALYSAIFKDEYDGAPDSKHQMGFGKTKEAAIADLIEQDRA